MGALLLGIWNQGEGQKQRSATRQRNTGMTLLLLLQKVTAATLRLFAVGGS